MSTATPRRPRTRATDSSLERFASAAVRLLAEEDPEIYELLELEYARQQHTLALVASCCPAHPSSLFCEGSFASNVTAEGYPGARYHGGCQYVDELESLAIERARTAFGARFANVQPHSASAANQVVMAAVLEPGDTLLGLQLDSGGHLSHGSRVNFSGRLYRAVGYGLAADGHIDYAQVERQAEEHRPRLIVCGTTAYPRAIDWTRFRRIADRVGAWVLADISHLAGLVITGRHPNPIDEAHFTTTCTHKQLYGPRGGLILMGRDWDAVGPDDPRQLCDRVQQAVFPFLQGAPIVNSIAAKARALGRATTPAFAELTGRIVTLAAALAEALVSADVRVVSGGTDNHIVLVDTLDSFGLTGRAAQQTLEDCRIIVNKNRVPGDTQPMTVTSGIRLGTNGIAARGLGDEQARSCADLLIRILRAAGQASAQGPTLAPEALHDFQAEVAGLCGRFPIADYPDCAPPW